MQPPKLDSEAFDFLNYYGSEAPLRIVLAYAEALLNAAEKEGIADRVGEELDSLVNDLFEKYPQFEATTATRRAESACATRGGSGSGAAVAATGARAATRAAAASAAKRITSL